MNIEMARNSAAEARRRAEEARRTFDEDYGHKLKAIESLEESAENWEAVLEFLESRKADEIEQPVTRTSPLTLGQGATNDDSPAGNA